MAGIAVEIFIKQQEVFVSWFLIEPVVFPVSEPLSCFVFFKEIDNPFGELVGDGFQRQLLSGAYGVFYHESFTIEFSILPDASDDEIIDGYPYRSAPVGIPAKKVGCRVARVVFDIIVYAAD